MIRDNEQKNLQYNNYTKQFFVITLKTKSRAITLHTREIHLLDQSV